LNINVRESFFLYIYMIENRIFFDSYDKEENEKKEYLKTIQQLAQLGANEGRLIAQYNESPKRKGFIRDVKTGFSELTDDDTIIRYEKGEVIGFTILNASKKKLSNVKVC